MVKKVKTWNNNSAFRNVQTCAVTDFARMEYKVDHQSVWLTDPRLVSYKYASLFDLPLFIVFINYLQFPARLLMRYDDRFKTFKLFLFESNFCDIGGSLCSIDFSSYISKWKLRVGGRRNIIHNCGIFYSIL